MSRNERLISTMLAAQVAWGDDPIETLKSRHRRRREMNAKFRRTSKEG